MVYSFRPELVKDSDLVVEIHQGMEVGDFTEHVWKEGADLENKDLTFPPGDKVRQEETFNLTNKL